VRSTAFVVTESSTGNSICHLRSPLFKSRLWPTVARHASHSGRQLRVLDAVFFTGDFLLDGSCRFFPAPSVRARRASAADLLVDFQQLLRQPTKAVTGLHLSLRLEPFGRGGKCFGDGIPFCLRVRREFT
jgi:hypothetical protein